MKLGSLQKRSFDPLFPTSLLQILHFENIFLTSFRMFTSLIKVFFSPNVLSLHKFDSRKLGFVSDSTSKEVLLGPILPASPFPHFEKSFAENAGLTSFQLFFKKPTSIRVYFLIHLCSPSLFAIAKARGGRVISSSISC